MTKGFVGREKELKWLRERFLACAKRDPETGAFIGGPQLAVIVAESGLGKSRLVQALYQELTTDPQWDPPEINYWPDTFDTPAGGASSQMLVNPDMKGHMPAGLPNFMWIGSRWCDPGERNVEVSSCKVVVLRDELHRHMEVIMERQGVWEKICATGGKELKKLKKNWLSTLTGQVADKLLPYGGLMVKAVEVVVSKLQQSGSSADSAEKAERREEESATDLLVEALQGLMSDRSRPLPVVLWLDDAHWMDAPTLQAVERIYRVSVREQLPLLIVATHWEREWEEKGATEDLKGLVAVTEDSKAVLRLGKGGASDLGGMLSDGLPGLTANQHALLVAKADGNFLTMVENISDLTHRVQFFEGRDYKRALTAAGEKQIDTWESKRARRVRQRFLDLGAETQQILGWSSHLGMRFLRGVVVAFAKSRGVQVDAEAELDQCENPLMILTMPDGCAQTREFRDRAFLDAAQREYGPTKEEWSEDLDAALRAHLVHWVNNSFDEDGDIVRPPEADVAEQNIICVSAAENAVPQEAAILLGAEERRDLLGMARAALPLPSEPDWDNPEHAAALRCRILSTWTDEMDMLWDRVRVVAAELEDVDWNCAESLGISFWVLNCCVEDWEVAGAERAARNLAQCQVARVRRAIAREPVDAARRAELGAALVDAGDLNRAAGDLGKALTEYEESLEIRRALLAEQGTPEARRDVSVSLDRIAYIEKNRGDLDAALAKYEESLEIARALLAELGTPGARRDVAFSLNNIASIGWQRGERAVAQAQYEESLEMRRALLAELDTPQARRAVAWSLNYVGRIERQRGELDAALAKHEESLEIRRRLLADVGTPEARRDVALSLNNIASIGRQRGELAAAQAQYEESLEIRRVLFRELGTRRTRLDVVWGLNILAGIERQRGQLAAALAKEAESLEIRRALNLNRGTPEARAHESKILDIAADLEQQRGEFDSALAKLEESLEIRRALLEELGTPEARRAVTISLERIADFEKECGDLEAAFAKYEQCLKDSRALLEARATPQCKQDVSRYLARIAGLEQLRGDLDAALAKYEESLEIRKRLLAELGTPGARRDVAFSLNNIARIQKERGYVDAALAKYEESLEIRRRLLAELGTPEARRDVAFSLNNIASIEKERGYVDAALAKYEESLEIRRRLLAELGTPEARRDVTISLERIADIEKERGDLEAAFAKYEQCLKDSRALLEAWETPQCKQDVSRYLARIAGIEQQRGDLDAALAKYEESLEIRKWLLAELGTPGARRDVAYSLNRIADIGRKGGDLAAAQAKYEESLAISRVLLEELGTPQARRDVTIDLERIADIEKQRGDLEAAFAKYEQCLKDSRALLEARETPQCKQDVSRYLARIAGIEQQRGDLDAAFAKYEEILGLQRGLLNDLSDEENTNGVAWTTTLVVGVLRAQNRHREGLERIRAVHDLAEQLGAPEVDDVGILDTAAVVWEETSACLAALGDAKQAAEFGERAKALRARIGG